MVIVALLLVPAQFSAITLTVWLAEQVSPLTVKLLSTITNSNKSPVELITDTL